MDSPPVIKVEIDPPDPRKSRESRRKERNTKRGKGKGRQERKLGILENAKGEHKRKLSKKQERLKNIISNETLSNNPDFPKKPDNMDHEEYMYFFHRYCKAKQLKNEKMRDKRMTYVRKMLEKNVPIPILGNLQKIHPEFPRKPNNIPLVKYVSLFHKYNRIKISKCKRTLDQKPRRLNQVIQEVLSQDLLIVKEVHDTPKSSSVVKLEIKTEPPDELFINQPNENSGSENPFQLPKPVACVKVASSH